MNQPYNPVNEDIFHYLERHFSMGIPDKQEAAYELTHWFGVDKDEALKQIEIYENYNDL